MSKRPQIHIFVGAPSIPSPLEVPEQSSSAPAGEKWKELHCLCDIHSLFSEKVEGADNVVFQAESSIVAAVPTSDDSSQQCKEGRLTVAKEYLTSLVPVAVTCTSTLKKTESLIYSDCQISEDRCTHATANEAADQHLPQKFAKSDRQDKQSHDCCSTFTERKAGHLDVNSFDVSDLVASTKQISIHLRSMEQGAQSDRRSDQHEHLSQYLDMFFPPNQESKPKGEPDIIMYENLWCGEIMLQSTFTSQLLNLGNCSALNPEEFYPIVDGGVLHGLLAYISSEFPHFGDIPRRQVQRLDSVQYVQLDQLQPNTLVHSILKIVNIAILTESVYSYRGGNQRKVILTVEQSRDQHYRMVLWGAGAAWCPQLQRKKDHIWDFKYLLVQHSSVSGDFELHTTPWSICECLFDDDKRAIEFKEKFQNSKTLLTTKLSAHLEEKCSGVVQVKARILELKFTISTGQYKQLIFRADTSLESVLASLPMMTYSGCAKCGLELQADENMIYKQCIRCLPYNKVKTFYRPALMTVEDEGYEIYVHVVSELMEKIFLNIPADWLNRLVVPSSDITYSTIVADLCHLLLADTEASYLLEIRSHFVLDENSYPLQKDFHLLNFYPDL